MKKETFNKIGNYIQQAHEKAHYTYSILDEVKDILKECEVDENDDKTIEDVLEQADALQSALFDFLNS